MRLDPYYLALIENCFREGMTRMTAALAGKCCLSTVARRYSRLKAEGVPRRKVPRRSRLSGLNWVSANRGRYTGPAWIGKAVQQEMG